MRRLIFKESGLIKGIHYTVQQHTSQGMPDYILNVSKGHSIIVDSKSPIDSLLKSFETNDKMENEQHMLKFIENVKNSITNLSKKEYAKIEESIVDYAIMVLPEHALLPAIYTDSDITSFAIDKKVILVTPSILLILLRTILLTWKEQELERSIKNIITKYINIQERLNGFSNEYNKLGKKVTDVITSYNKCIDEFNKDIKPLVSDISASVRAADIIDLKRIDKSTNRMLSES